MTKPEVVDWLLENGFVKRSERKLRFYRSYSKYTPYYKNIPGLCLHWETCEEWVYIQKGFLRFSDTGGKDSYTEYGLKYIHLDDDDQLVLGDVLELPTISLIPMPESEHLLLQLQQARERLYVQQGGNSR